MGALKQCREEKSDSALKSRGILCSDPVVMLKDLTTKDGTLNRYFTGDMMERSDYRSSGADDNSDNETNGADFRDMKNSLCGRVWTGENKKVISFWNEQPKILKLWPQIQKMFKSFSSMLDNISDYKIDWIERSNDDEIRMTPASSVTSSSGEPEEMETDVPSTEEGGQMNFIKQMFQFPDKLESLSKEQLKSVREKLHVLNPEVKGQFIKLLGQSSTNKIAAIADKLGMTAAEFRSLTSLDEVNTSD
jgi:hypothetical protein